MSKKAAPSGPLDSVIPIALVVNGVIMNRPGETVRIPISMIRPYKRNPRKHFDQKKLDDLAKSLGEKPAKGLPDNRDVEQAVHVTLEEDGTIAELVNGERRFRGSRIADIFYLSSFIRSPMTDGEKLLSATRQNLFQEPMSPIEEATAYKDLMEEYGWDVNELAKNIGKKVDPINRALKYLNLNQKLQSALLYGRIDKGVALVIANLLASEHQDYMLDKLAAISTERGKPIHPNEATRICRKEVEIHGFPLRTAKKGKKRATHAQLTARNLRIRIKQVDKALAELAQLDKKALQDLKKPTYLEIEEDLAATRKSISATLDTMAHLN